MLKKIQNPKSAFDRYFREADDTEDSVSVTVAPRKNRGTDYDEEEPDDGSTSVTVAPRANRGTDYSSDDEETTTDDETTDDTPEEPAPDSPDTGDEEDGTDYSDTGDEETGEDTDDETGDDGADGDEESPDGPDTGDGETDYSSDDAGDENADGDSEEGGEESTETNDDDKDEKRKKFNMYRRFIHLYNVIKTIIDKLKNVVKDDPVQNAVIKRVINNLTDVRDNMFDFMTVKYKSSSYVQILIFFETAISIVKLNFELVRNNKINLKQ